MTSIIPIANPCYTEIEYTEELYERIGRAMEV